MGKLTFGQNIDLSTAALMLCIKIQLTQVYINILVYESYIFLSNCKVEAPSIKSVYIMQVEVNFPWES